MKLYWYNTLLDLAVWATRWADVFYYWAHKQVEAAERAQVEAETLERATHE